MIVQYGSFKQGKRICSAGVNVGPEKIRFKREVNGRKVCKELIARIEPRGCTSETGDKNYKQWQRTCTCVHPLTGFARSWKQCCMVPSFICYLKKHFTFTVRFFDTNKDEEAFRDILLHPETGLNVVTVTHPVTLKRFVVSNNPSCDVSMFLNHFTQEFLSGDENADQLRLDQETVSALLKSMDTEYDRYIKSDYRITPHAV